VALYLLQHLEVCSPASKGSSGHWLFISAFMPASRSSAMTSHCASDHFIPYALHCTCLQCSATFVALYLLQHLEVCSPASKGSSGHWLFISAFMPASRSSAMTSHCALDHFIPMPVPHSSSTFCNFCSFLPFPTS